MDRRNTGIVVLRIKIFLNRGILAKFKHLSEYIRCPQITYPYLAFIRKMVKKGFTLLDKFGTRVESEVVEVFKLLLEQPVFDLCRGFLGLGWQL